MKEQPETKLVQRINKGQSGKNEAVHSKKNQLFEHVARMSKELAQPRMAFRIHLANEQVDIKFGLRDPHNLTLPWEEAAINDSTDGLFDAPPFPALTDSHLSGNAFALPPLVPVYGDDQEPMGFEYSTNERNSRDLAAVYRLLDGYSSVVSSVSADGGGGSPPLWRTLHPPACACFPHPGHPTCTRSPDCSMSLLVCCFLTLRPASSSSSKMATGGGGGCAGASLSSLKSLPSSWRSRSCLSASPVMSPASPLSSALSSGAA